MKKLYILFNILIMIGLISCNHEVKNETTVEESLMEISKEQFHAEKMELGKVTTVEMKEKMAFTGKIVPKTDGIVKISAPVPGKIIAVLIKRGDHVQPNATLFKIGGTALIDLQQLFASSSAKLKQLESNYDKAKKLFDEHIKSENEYLLAESSYKVELANYSALKAKLQNIGLNLLDIENGKYVSQYSVKAPISGQISEIDIVVGQQISTDTEIAEIVNNNKIELQIALFGKDYLKLKIGQQVTFWDIEKNAAESTAIIDRIGAKLHPNSNTIDCFATISTLTNAYAINQMVNGEIILFADSVLAIPQAAVFAVENSHYVLVIKSKDDNRYLFERQKINTGKTSNGYTEILENLKEEILINGTYNINIE